MNNILNCTNLITRTLIILTSINDLKSNYRLSMYSYCNLRLSVLGAFIILNGCFFSLKC